MLAYYMKHIFKVTIFSSFLKPAGHDFTHLIYQSLKYSYYAVFICSSMIF